MLILILRSRGMQKTLCTSTAPTHANIDVVLVTIRFIAQKESLVRPCAAIWTWTWRRFVAHSCWSGPCEHSVGVLRISERLAKSDAVISRHSHIHLQIFGRNYHCAAVHSPSPLLSYRHRTFNRVLVRLESLNNYGFRLRSVHVPSLLILGRTHPSISPQRRFACLETPTLPYVFINSNTVCSRAGSRHLGGRACLLPY